jgi:hypothetical protein
MRSETLNELTACCAEVSADVENNKQKTEEATAKAAESEKKKKKKAEADDAKKRVEFLPVCAGLRWDGLS